MLLALVFSHTANCVAACGSEQPLSTAVDDPPQLEATKPEEFHCGSGATAQSPEVPGAFCRRIASPHDALIQLTTPPSCRSLYQPLAKSFSVLISPRETRPFQ